MIRVVMADDHRIFREGLGQLLTEQSEIQLVAQVGDGEALIAQLKEAPVDVVILDVSMPGPGAAELCRDITADYPDIKIVILTMHQQVDLAEQLLAAGASAFVLKRSAFDELRDALSAVTADETYVSPTLAGKIAVRSRGRSAMLSAREEEVAKLVADGHTNRRIATMLSISVKTVESHRGRAMEKLGVRTSAGLVRRLHELGLLAS